MRLSFIILAGFLSVATLASAEQAHPSSVSAAVQAGEQEYVTARNKLSDAQKGELAALDNAFATAMTPLMESYDVGGKFLFCLEAEQRGSAISSKQPQYIAAFKTFHAEKESQQQAMWLADREKARKITFISHDLLDKHFAYIQISRKTAAEAAVHQAAQAGVYRNTNCVEVQNLLDEAVRRKAAENTLVPPQTGTKPAENAPQTPQRDPKEGVSGTPAP